MLNRSMINPLSLIFHIRLLIAVLLCGVFTRAETFIVGDGLTNTITVAKGEVIITSFADGNGTALYSDGTNRCLTGMGFGSAFAGPCTLEFSRGSALRTF